MIIKFKKREIHRVYNNTYKFVVVINNNLEIGKNLNTTANSCVLGFKKIVKTEKMFYN